MLFEYRLQNIEMYRAHLRCKDRISLCIHGPVIFRTTIADGFWDGFNIFLFPHIHCRNQTSYTDSDSAEVIDFIYFQNSVEFVTLLENFVYLIRCYCIQSAPEGVELNQLKVVSLPNELSRGIKPRMVHPLIDHAQASPSIII